MIFGDLHMNQNNIHLLRSKINLKKELAFMTAIKYIVLFFLFTSFSTHKNISTDRANHMMAFGRMKFDFDIPNANSKMTIHFNGRVIKDYVTKLDQRGYFYLELPMGTNHIALIEFEGGPGYYINFDKKYLTVKLETRYKVYYLGDIYFKWKPGSKDMRKANTTIEGSIDPIGVSILESVKDGDRIPVQITENEESTDYFKERFPENKFEIITNLMKVDTAR